MIVPDANLLLYTVDSTSPFHNVAREWWTGCLNGAVPVGLCHPVVFAFVESAPIAVPSRIRCRWPRPPESFSPGASAK